jgi:DNA-binding MarR family transcriptional regulator
MAKSFTPIPIDTLSRQIFVFISLATKLAGRDQDQRIAGILPGIRGLEFGVLQILRDREHTLGELAQMMLLASATLVPVVDRLEKKKLVRRGSDPQDRRRTPLRLTEHGRALIARIPQFSPDDLMNRSLQAMGAEKAARLNELLKELVQYLSPEEDLVGKVLINMAGINQKAKE